MSDLPMPDITRCLCWYDPRNPNYLEPDSDDEVRPPRIGCSCDNCFYGRDGLAIEILRLTAERDALKRVPLTEHQVINLLWEAEWPRQLLSDFVMEKLVFLIRKTERAHGIGGEQR